MKLTRRLQKQAGIPRGPGASQRTVHDRPSNRHQRIFRTPLWLEKLLTAEVYWKGSDRQLAGSLEGVCDGP
jgi:hypothetical protein